MSGTTTPDAIYYATTGDPVDPANESSLQATSIQTALTNRKIQTYKWANTAARTAQTGMAEGDVGDQADTDQRWRYSGSAWVNITNGMFPIIPTSVAGSGVTRGAGGKVTIDTATTASVNGCFTSAYENYTVVFDYTTSAVATASITLRGAGFDAATAYDNQRFLIQGATIASLQSLNSTAIISSGGVGFASGRNVGTLELFSPAAPAATQGHIKNTITANPMTATSAVYFGGFLHRTLTAYDGFTFTPSAGTITGSVRIYGWNNN